MRIYYMRLQYFRKIKKETRPYGEAFEKKYWKSDSINCFMKNNKTEAEAI